MDNRAKQHGEEAAAQLRRGECVRLKLDGYSYADIVATGLYNSRSAARDAFNKSLRENYTEPTEAARHMEVARIDALITANWDAAINGPGVKIKIETGKYVLSLINSKCRILGIDAPQKVDLVGMLSNLAKAAGVSPEDAIREADGLLLQQQNYMHGRA